MLHNQQLTKSPDHQIAGSPNQMSESPPTTDLFQALVEHSSDAIVLVDATGKILFLSQTSERLLGHPIAERLGKGAFDHVHPDDVPALEAVFADLLRQPRVPKTI